MSEKARGAIFNALGDIHGLTVLDAYAGSGALTYEAISRGARHVTTVELDKGANTTIVKNLTTLGIEDQVTMVRRNIGSWAKSNHTGEFDVVFADPPYDDIWPDVVGRVGLLAKQGGLFVLSWPGKEPTREFAGLSEVNTSKYGDAQLVFYRRI